MYHSAGFVTVAAVTAPFVGLSLIWILLAIFTLLMATGAVWRALPKKEA
jgi:hypothetical protein